MGNAFKDQNETSKALDAYNKTISLKPDNEQTFNNIGIIFQEQGKLEEALQAFSNALKIKPDFQKAGLHFAELLKMNFKKASSHDQNLFRINQQVILLGNNISPSNSDDEIADCVNRVLEFITKEDANFKTNLSQIYKHNRTDLNCTRHMKVFNTENIIPDFCFNCVKVQVEVDNLFSLIRLTRFLYDMSFHEDITRKTMIELRPDIPGYYKAFLYCRGLTQAFELKSSLDTNLENTFKGQFTCKIKRGCSEFAVKFPDYSTINDNKGFSMKYPEEWRKTERKFDKSNYKPQLKNPIESVSHFCISDFYIIQKWIDYAKGLGDPSSTWFDDRPIIFQNIHDAAVERNSKFGKIF